MVNQEVQKIYAATHNLLEKLWNSYPFLAIFFQRRGYSVQLVDRPLRKATHLRGQVRWLQRQFPVILCLLQIGMYFEVFDDAAERFSAATGFKLNPDWRGYRCGCGFPRWLLPKVEQLLREKGVSYIIVEQTGREQRCTLERGISRMVLVK